MTPTLIHYAQSAGHFVLQQQDGKHNLQQDKLLAFLAEDIRRNVDPGDDGLARFLARRLKRLDQQRPLQPQ